MNPEPEKPQNVALKKAREKGLAIRRAKKIAKLKTELSSLVGEAESDVTEVETPETLPPSPILTADQDAEEIERFEIIIKRKGSRIINQTRIQIDPLLR